MKIIQIGSFPLDSQHIKGGVEASVYGLSQALIQLGHQVTVLDLPRKQSFSQVDEKIEGVEVQRFRIKGANIFSFIRIPAYLISIKKLKTEVCHIHSSSLFCFLLYLILTLQKKKILVTIHGLAHIEKKNQLQQRKSLSNYFKYFYQSTIEFIFLSLCHSIIVDTEYVKKQIENWRRTGKIWRMPVCHVIPQGIDPLYFDIERSPVGCKLLSVGAFNKRKGHLLLIKAMAEVVQRFPDCILTIAGVSNQSSYLEAMRNEIDLEGLRKHVFLYPNTAFDELLALYMQASIFGLHSEEESQGIVLCEAMAMGLPVVSTKSGGIPYVVEDGKNGLLSDYGNYRDFANHIVSLLEDENKRISMSMINRTEALKYDWLHIAEEIYSLYKK